MQERFSRTELLFGEEGMKKLFCARVAVFGVGGVGGHAAEALVRSGIGEIDLIDADVVSLSNINRQIVALESTVGKSKVEAAKERFLDINPEIKINAYKKFFDADAEDEFDFSDYDYVIDAIDTVTGKLLLVKKAVQAGVPVISSMGAGNKLDPTAFEVADIFKTSVCPLARVMRRELKKMGIKKLKVVYSKEEPIKSGVADELTGKAVPASCAFVPSVVGLIIASEVVKDIALR